MFSFLREKKRKRPSRRSRYVVDHEHIRFREHMVLVSRRPYKRTIGVSLQINGEIRVSAPTTMTTARIEAFLVEHAGWIESHLEKYRALRDRYPRKSYREGEEFLFLGRRLPLRFVEGRARSIAFDAKNEAIEVAIPQAQWNSFDRAGEHPEIASTFAIFYSETGKRLLRERLEFFSARMGLKPTSLSFGAQKTRWGSCSSRGRISLNWRLVIAPLEVIDYVVVHELAHLRCYDHSPSFWSLVGGEISDYEGKRAWLREHQYEADFLGKKSELYD